MGNGGWEEGGRDGRDVPERERTISA